MDINERRINILLRNINIARYGNEGDVSGVADILLYISGFNADHGYRTTFENPISGSSRPDIRIEVYEDLSQAGEQLLPVLVIELKRRQSVRNTRDEHNNQLFRYMRSGNFPHGILMYANEAYFYVNDNDNIEQEKNSQFDNIAASYQEIIDRLVRIRILYQKEL
ncbi:hypothetical protein BB561_002783 [Smittium simulii]|uniref:Uncharacterized protein n=1 Tax=Smittium simulii TaxID=133385 RepID=A0A2T9YP19_9FUNG|nr:hypothetical protein BB561_002784 [Smittium simulii]PVU94096.1 hypothetical protein BB561_002782 [Smittium simulii]PVU94098.1 hypothetical protein BB561_002783 [Smittium simulii]